MSTSLPFEPIIEPLGDHHNRAAFHCGVDALDRYFHQQAGQDMRKQFAVPYVLLDPRSSKVAGFYTLSSCGIETGALPPEVTRRLPRYTQTPAILMGRLAVDTDYRSQGLGQLLLMDAMHRAWQHSQELGSYALVVDAKDDSALDFYARYEFIRFPDHPYRLFLPMATIAQLFPDPA